MTRVILAILIVLISQSTLAQQPSVAIISNTKTVGWFIGKVIAKGDVEIMTVDGHVMFLSSANGTFSFPEPNLGFLNETCEGQAYSPNPRPNEIFQIGLPETQLFARGELTTSLVSGLTMNSQLNESGICEPWITAQYPDMFPVALIPNEELSTYGIRLVEGQWRVPIESVVVSHPDAMFCNGFESCPQQ